MPSDPTYSNISANTAAANYSSPPGDANASGVSWAAIIAGAFVTAALALILLALGAGAGLSSLSPWAGAGASTTTVGVGALLWITFIEIVSCAIGGYMAGRLRTKWVNVHTDEVYFRDTAHGFLVWAVALVMTAAFLTTAASAMVGSENRDRNAPRSAEAVENANRYYIDSLFRSSQAPAANDSEVREEVGLIFTHSLRQRELSAEDKAYVSSLVASKTGVSQADAEKRVTNIFQLDQQAVDKARKAVAHSLYWLFVALLLGAFCASLGATFGGRRRDHVHV
jgi:hypothetical protein